MKTTLVRIGQARGVRIPQSIIDRCGFGKEVEMSVHGNALVIAPARVPRQGWDEAFASMAVHGDDEPLLPDDLAAEVDADEWQW